MKHLFIVNPAAGYHDRSREITAQIDAAMNGRSLNYEIVVTAAPRQAEEIIRSAAAAGGELRVYACGGDGTLNETVNGAAGFDNVSVTHYPCGSGNDFIKIFGGAAERFADLNELINGENALLDLIECNGRYGINICSVGLDARIGVGMQDFKRFPFISGRAAYNLSTIYNVLRGISRPYFVRVDGREFKGDLTMLVACNGRYYGGGFNPAPQAKPDDGLLDFLVVKKVSRFTIARVVSAFAEGRFTEYPEYGTYIRGRRMDIACDRESPINIDGERLDATELTFKVSERKICFCYPRGASWRNQEDGNQKINEDIKTYQMNY